MHKDISCIYCSIPANFNEKIVRVITISLKWCTLLNIEKEKNSQHINNKLCLYEYLVWIRWYGIMLSTAANIISCWMHIRHWIRWNLGWVKQTFYFLGHCTNDSNAILSLEKYVAVSAFADGQLLHKMVQVGKSGKFALWCLGGGSSYHVDSGHQHGLVILKYL